MSLYAFFVFSGALVASSFAPVIFKQVEGFNNPYLGGILLGGGRTLVTFVTAVVFERFPRRTWLIINGAFGSLSCLVTSLYFFYKEDLAEYPWIPLVSVVTIVCLVSLGVSPLMNVMLSELLPNAIRAEVGGINLMAFGAFNFAMLYSFPRAEAVLGLGGLFACFAGMHLLMVFFGWICLPETRGKSIEDIQKLFMKAKAGDVEDVDVSTTVGDLPHSDIAKK